MRGAAMRVVGAGAARVDRPRYVWLAVVLEIFTAIGAIPVGLMFLADPSGGMIQMQPGWIEGTVFKTYLVPGLYLLLVNGIGMLVMRGTPASRQRSVGSSAAVSVLLLASAQA